MNQHNQTTESCKTNLQENLMGYIVVATYHDSVAVIGEVISDPLYDDNGYGVNACYAIKLMEDIDNSANPAVIAAKAGDVILVNAKDIKVKVNKQDVTGIVPVV